MKNKIKDAIKEHTYNVSSKTELRGIPEVKKQHILDKLGNLMPPDRRAFYENLISSDVLDLLREVWVTSLG